MIYDFHPPGDARLFRMPAKGVRRLDDEAFVAEVSYGDVTLRHYAFRDHWFKVNCTLDSEGRFVETASPASAAASFAFNCDIATPMVRRDDAVFAVDLWLDVLVRADSVTYAVNDEDDFAAAISHGWLSEREVAGARAALCRLVDLIERRELVDFLTAVHPFAPTVAPAAPDMQHVGLSDVALVHAGARPTW